MKSVSEAKIERGGPTLTCWKGTRGGFWSRPKFDAYVNCPSYHLASSALKTSIPSSTSFRRRPADRSTRNTSRPVSPYGSGRPTSPSRPVPIRPSRSRDNTVPSFVFATASVRRTSCGTYGKRSPSPYCAFDPVNVARVYVALLARTSHSAARVVNSAASPVRFVPGTRSLRVVAGSKTRSSERRVWNAASEPAKRGPCEYRRPTS